MHRLVIPFLAATAGLLLAKGVSRGKRSEPFQFNAPAASISSPEPNSESSRIDATLAGSAARTAQAIDGMTLADFQAIANDPSRIPPLPQALEDFEFGGAYVDALVERWLIVDPENGYASIRRAVKTLTSGGDAERSTARRFAYSLAERRPAETVANLPEKPDDERMRNELDPAMEALAKRDIRAAQAALNRFTKTEDRERAERAMVKGLAESDPVAAAKWIEALPAGLVRDKALQGFSDRADSADPFIAGEWVANIGDPTLKMEGVRSVYQEMNSRDPNAARAWVRSLEGIDPIWRDHMIKLGRW